MEKWGQMIDYERADQHGRWWPLCCSLRYDNCFCRARHTSQDLDQGRAMMEDNQLLMKMRHLHARPDNAIVRAVPTFRQGQPISAIQPASCEQMARFSSGRERELGVAATQGSGRHRQAQVEATSAWVPNRCASLWPRAAIGHTSPRPTQEQRCAGKWI